MAKHKGKRNKGRRESAEPQSGGATAAARSVAVEKPPETSQGGSPVTARPDPAGPPAARAGATVIQFPKSPALEAAALAAAESDAPIPNVTTRTTMRAGSGSTPPATAPSTLQPAEDEAGRITLAPTSPSPAGDPEAAASETSGVKTLTMATVAPVAEVPAAAAPAPEAPAPATVSEAPSAYVPTSHVKTLPMASLAVPVEAPTAEAVSPDKPDAKKDAVSAQKPSSAKDAGPKPAGPKDSGAKVAIPRRDERRTHKESLSTHLSEEAQAFFSDASFESAYKVRHDNFDDLKPIASPEHAKELQHSRRWMAVTGAMLFGVVALLVGFSLAGRFGVSETALDTSAIRNIPEPAPRTTALPESTPAPSEPPPAAPPAAEGPAPAAPITPVVPPGTPPAAAASPPAPAPPAAEPPAAAPAAAPAAPPTPPPAAAVPEPAPAVAPPSGQTPQELLAAARAFRGPFAGRVAAWEAYFTAAPTQDRMMADMAFNWAEGHPAEAERLAARAVAANPNNSKAWFVLAYTRGRLHNADGRREALARCIALGGSFAAECRAL